MCVRHSVQTIGTESGGECAVGAGGMETGRWGERSRVWVLLSCLALELVGSWVVLGFSVGMEAFDELLSINVPWSQEFSGVLSFWI